MHQKANYLSTAKPTQSLCLSILLAGLAGMTSSLSAGVIFGSTADYEVYSETTPFGTRTMATGEIASSLRAHPTNGPSDSRAIFQFDLSEFSGSEINSAEIGIVGSQNINTSYGMDEPSFNVELYGRGNNLSNKIEVTAPNDPAAIAEYPLAPPYSRIDGDTQRFATPTDPTYDDTDDVLSSMRTYDVTSFLQSAFNEYQNGSGDAWVLFKLVADTSSGTGQYRFESAAGRDGTGGTDDLRPRLAINQPIPEPASAALLLGGIVLVAALARRR